MNSEKLFKGYVSELINGDQTYKNVLEKFINFLEDRLIIDRAFDLNKSDINEYFIYSYEGKIKADPTFTTHTSALKCLFRFLNKKGYNFSELLGHVSMDNFKEMLDFELVKTFSKPIMSTSLLNATLKKMDSYIDININSCFKKRDKKHFFKVMICGLFAKLSLLIPLKTSEMLKLKMGDISIKSEKFLEYNSIKIKIKASLMKQIIEAINYAQKEYGKSYLENDVLFDFLYGAIDLKASTNVLSDSFVQVYNRLEIKDMLVKVEGGIKDRFVYPAECYKITAINNMLKNGVNILYVSKLTGLSLHTLVSDFDFLNEINWESASAKINDGIADSEYYQFI